MLQHLVLGIDAALGNILKDDIMNTMLAKINQKWQYDELTGLYNRSGFVNNVERLIDVANRTNQGISVIFFDLDGLKKVNDGEGHEAGDRYIQSMANLLKDHTKNDDVVCRYGGDEYVVVSAEASKEDSDKKLNQILDAVKAPLSVSAGYAFDQVSGIDELNQLIEQADQRMYVYKKQKKNGQR